MEINEKMSVLASDALLHIEASNMSVSTDLSLDSKQDFRALVDYSPLSNEMQREGILTTLTLLSVYSQNPSLPSYERI